MKHFEFYKIVYMNTGAGITMLFVSEIPNWIYKVTAVSLFTLSYSSCGKYVDIFSQRIGEAATGDFKAACVPATYYA